MKTFKNKIKNITKNIPLLMVLLPGGLLYIVITFLFTAFASKKPYEAPKYDNIFDN